MRAVHDERGLLGFTKRHAGNASWRIILVQRVRYDFGTRGAIEIARVSRTCSDSTGQGFLSVLGMTDKGRALWKRPVEVSHESS